MDKKRINVARRARLIITPGLEAKNLLGIWLMWFWKSTHYHIIHLKYRKLI